MARSLAQERFAPQDLQADPALPLTWLRQHGPFDLIAGPSGYGLPLLRSSQCRQRDFDLMALVRPDERGQAGGVTGFCSLLRNLAASPLPLIFLPGVIHLPTVPAQRKINRIDLGTADKVCVAALALARRASRVFPWPAITAAWWSWDRRLPPVWCSAAGRIVAGLGGSLGPPGWSSCGAWDGELAYLLSPLAKRDLFVGGAGSSPIPSRPGCGFGEELLRAVAGLRGVTDFDEIVLSGRLLESEPQVSAQVEADLDKLRPVSRLSSLPRAWVKHAAQGAALLADGLAGGRYLPLIEHLQLCATRPAPCSTTFTILGRRPYAAGLPSKGRTGGAAFPACMLYRRMGREGAQVDSPLSPRFNLPLAA